MLEVLSVTAPELALSACNWLITRDKSSAMNSDVNANASVAKFSKEK